MLKPNASKSRLFSAGLYIAALLTVSLLIYSTLFVRAYTPDGQSDPASQTQPSSESGTPSQSHSDDDSITYKTWPKGDTKATVLLDAGHGGMDGGNATGDVLEKDINLSITNKIAGYLKEFNPNIDVKVIREDDSVPWMEDELSDLNHRLAQQTEQNADYFFSIHANAFDDPSVEGVVFFVNENDPTMKDLVSKIQDNMQAVNWAENYNTIDYEKLQVVTMSDIHSTLIELGYMTNPEDLAHLTSEQEQDKVAKAIAAAISDYIMEHPDAPKYQKPEEEKAFEASLASELSAQASIDQAAAKHQAEAASSSAASPEAPAQGTPAADGAEAAGAQ